MTKPKVKEVNAETGEEIIRDATAEEIAVYEAEQAFEAAKQAEAEARESARQALLSRLGITQEEAQLLLGGK
jgi:hypothetical protein